MKLQVSEMEKAMGICRKTISKSRNFLVESCKFHNLSITNIIFKNNHGQQVTWTLPLPPSFLHNNSYRKQIDYILFKRGNNSKIFKNNIKYVLEEYP